MEIEEKVYCCECLYKVWDNPEQNIRSNMGMEAESGINSSGNLQYDWDNPKDNVKMKEDMIVGKGIESTENCASRQEAPEKKNYFPRKLISA